MDCVIDADALSRATSALHMLMRMYDQAEALTFDLAVLSAGREVELCGTNGRTSLVGKLGSEVLRSGEVALELSKLHRIAEAPGDKAIRIQLQDGWALVTRGRATFRLRAFEAASSPWIPEVGSLRAIIDAEKLAAAIRRTAFACASTDTTWPGIPGLLLRVTKGRLQAIAADQHLMSHFEVDVTQQAFPDAILDAESTALVAHLLADRRGGFGWHRNGNFVSLVRPPFVVTTRSLEWKLPDFERLLKLELPFQVGLRASDLANVFARVDALPGRTIRLAISAGLLTVATTRNAGARAEEPMAVSYNGPRVSLKLERLHLSQGLATFGSEAIAIEWRDDKTPMRLRSLENSANVLLMPLSSQP